MANTQALVTKSNASGFTPPEWVRSETCEVFADRVEITKQMGMGEKGVRLNETRKVKLTGNLEQLVAQVAKEELTEKENGLCDGPSTTISARENLIFTTGGCGSPRKERQGASSRILREIVDSYCATTHDFGARD